MFGGPQIHKLINKNFTKVINDSEAFTWYSYVLVIKNFLGDHKVDRPKELVQNMLKNVKNVGTNMSIKAHFLHKHYGTTESCSRSRQQCPDR